MTDQIPDNTVHATDTRTLRAAPVEPAGPKVRETGGPSAQPIQHIELDELAQAKLRNSLQILLVALSLVAHHFDPRIGLLSVVYTSIASFVIALPLYVWALGMQRGWIRPETRFYQRCACIISDNLFISLVIHIGGESLAAVWALYIWISVGYGVRYGVAYLRWNVLVSVIAFALTVLFTSFWREHIFFSLGLGAAMAAVPLYISWLIARLHTLVSQREFAYQARSEFLARMSHELRTPLHAIISTTELLKDPNSVDNQKDLLNIIDVSSTTLLGLINRVLDLSKFEAGAISLTSAPVNIHALANEVGVMLWPEARRKGLDLRIYSDPSIPASLEGPPEQLKEVLTNLLGNAVKFTEAGVVSLSVHLDSDADSTSTLRMLISDTGPGIPQSILPVLFDPFVQGDTSIKRKHGGTGLGTSISKELVRLMGGTIYVSSEPGLGTTFEVRLTLRKLDSPTNLHYAYPGSLAIISSAPIPNSLKSSLESLHVRIHEHTSFQDALASLEDDSESARMRGYLVHADDFADNLAGPLAQIRRSLIARPVAVAAFGSPEFRLAAINAGYASYCSDFSLPTIASVVTTVFSQVAPSVAKSTPSYQKARSIRPLKILAADDDATNRFIIARVLSNAGHFCRVMDNGEDALYELHDSHYDLAILDMHMPKRDGAEVARIYRYSRFDSSQSTPIILLTADSTLQARSEAESAGISQFLTKPIRPSDLLDAVDRCVNRREGPALEFELPIGGNVSALVGEGIQNGALEELHGAYGFINDSTIADLLAFMSKDEQSTFFSEFCEDASTYVSSLEKVHDASDISAALRDMHALAGAAFTVGADQLAQSAKAIEALPELELLEKKDVLAQNLRMQCDSAVREIFARFI